MVAFDLVIKRPLDRNQETHNNSETSKVDFASLLFPISTLTNHPTFLHQKPSSRRTSSVKPQHTSPSSISSGLAALSR